MAQGMTAHGPQTTLSDPPPCASLTVAIDFGDIPGKPILQDTISFDGTAAGFDRVFEEMRVAMHAQAESPMRPCGHPGPWWSA